MMMIRRILQSFNDLSIKYKLLVSYLLLITIPLCAFLFINTFATSRETEQQSLYSARRVFNQTKSYLDFKTESIRNSLNYIAINDTVQEVLMRHPGDYYRNIGLWSIDSDKFVPIFFSAKGSSDVAGFHIYMKQGLALIFQNEEFINIDTALHTAWYQKLMAGPDFIRWYPKESFPAAPNGNYIYALRNIISVVQTSGKKLSESLGVIKADIPESVFRKILDQAMFTKSTSAALINNSHEMICASREARIRDPRTLMKIMSRLRTDNFSESVWKTIRFGSERMLVGAQGINKTDWYLLLVIPYRDILEFSDQSRRQMLLVFLLIALLTFPLAFLVSASATNRIQKLTKQIRKVETGNFGVTLQPGNHDEIGTLTHNFNFMVTKIATLMDEKYQLGREIKHLELKALQAQINPHFLYNTLDLINWMAIRANAPEIRKVVEALSKFYRLSLSKGEDMVSLHDELEHVKAFVAIQNMRFDNGIRLEVEIPEELRDYRIIKLILQPIVENSILHGILEKDCETGTITIRAAIGPGAVWIYIADDGVGMTPEAAAAILSAVSIRERHGYGLKNIDERIKLNYGGEFGLSFASKPGEGVQVTIKIPAIRNDAAG